MSETLVERLRNRMGPGPLMREAADRITELEAALGPFACDCHDACAAYAPIMEECDCYRARAALKGGKDDA